MSFSRSRKRHGSQSPNGPLFSYFWIYFECRVFAPCGRAGDCVRSMSIDELEVPGELRRWTEHASLFDGVASVSHQDHSARYTMAQESPHLTHGRKSYGFLKKAHRFFRLESTKNAISRGDWYFARNCPRTELPRALVLLAT